MADDSKDGIAGNQGAGPRENPAAKRPYSTLDLKATEIKITPLQSAPNLSSAARGSTVLPASFKDSSEATSPAPIPAPPSSYANVDIAGDMKTADAGSGASTGAAAQTTAKPEVKSGAAAETRIYTMPPAATGTAASATAAPSAKAAQGKPGAAAVQKRGGFFSHLTAGVLGGALAFAGSQWALPQLGFPNTTTTQTSETVAQSTAIVQRLQALEKQPKNAPAESANDLTAMESRLASLEKSAQKIPELTERQNRLVADTKAALAASASDAGAPEQLTRLASVEDKLKALAEAGASNPNAGRLEQLAALTGKVADLETSLATQLTALRKGVSEDVDARIASVTASAEAAKSGTQRVDKDVAGVKSGAVALAEQVSAMKTDNDRLTATLKMAQDETTALKTEVQALRASTAKPTDVAAAVKPVGEKLSSLEQNVQGLMKAEEEHKASSERMLLSLELQNLKRALDGGQKYSAELTAVQKASGGKFDLAALDKFKETGVPVQADLSRDFRAVATAAIDADSEPESGGVVDKLIAGAKSVIHVRKVDHAPDDKTAEAVVGRMETALKESRLADVVGEAKQLSPKALAVAQPFVDRVNARVSVDNAVGAIEMQLKSALGSGPGSAAASSPRPANSTAAPPAAPPAASPKSAP